MIWPGISWYSSCLIVIINDQIPADIYLGIRNNNVRTMATIFSLERDIFQDDNVHRHTAKNSEVMV